MEKKLVINKATIFIAIISILLLSACSQLGSGSSDDAYYEGKTIELLVPFGTGGGTDVFARYIDPYLNKYVEGNPSIQTVNVPGGESITGANEFELSRRHDGYTLLVTSASTHTPYFLGDPAVKYDLKKLKPIIGLPTGGVVYVHPDTGITGPENIHDSEVDLIYAGISATGLDLVTLLAFEVLEMDVQAVLGYEGRGPSRVAFEQGESNIDYQTTIAYLTNVVPLVEDGEAIPLFSLGQLDADGDVIRDPAFPDIPSIKEFYEEAFGIEPSGEAWEAYKSFLGSSYTIQKVIWTHDDAPEEALIALRAAAEKIVEDEEFLEKGEEVLGGYEPYTGEELENVVNAMLDTDEAIIQWVKEFLEEKYDVKPF